MVNSNLRHDTPVAILYRANGREYWVKGYKIFRPPKDSPPVKIGKTPVWTGNGRVFYRPNSEIQKIRPGVRYYSFEEVYGDFQKTGIAQPIPKTDPQAPSKRPKAAQPLGRQA